MITLRRALLGLSLAAGFWAAPFLLMLWEKVLPFLETRFMYPFYFYGSARWLVPLGMWWGIQLFSLFEYRLTLPARWTGRMMAAVLGAHWLLLIGYCSDPSLWVEGNGWQLLLFRTEQQAQWYISLLIALNLITGKLFGLFWTVNETGHFGVQWSFSTNQLWAYGILGIFLLLFGAVIYRKLRRRSWYTATPAVDTLLRRWVLVLGVVLIVSPRGLSIEGLADAVPFIVSWLLLIGLSAIQLAVVSLFSFRYASLE